MTEWLTLAGLAVGQLVTVGALYGAIRADLKHTILDARAAHRRLDDHLGDHLTGAICWAQKGEK